MAVFVIDSSAMVSLALGENPEGDERIARLLRTEGGLSPAHFPAEVANSLVMAVRRKRIDEPYRLQRLAEIGQLPIEIDAPLDWQAAERVSGLATRSKLSVYDAIYLDLALRTGLPLATYDDALAVASKEAGVEVV